MLDTHFNALVDFLLSTEPSPSPPFPILASDENVHRHDPWDAIALHQIFRYPWERRFPATKPPDTRDVRSTGDYPELAAMFTAMNDPAHHASEGPVPQFRPQPPSEIAEPAPAVPH
jgi:hypothetical protein